MKFILLWLAILKCVFGTSHVSVKLPYNNPAGVTYVEGSASSDLVAGPSQRVTAKSTGTETRRNHSEDFQRYEVLPDSSTTVSTSKAAMPYSPSILAALSGNYFHPGSISSLHGQQPTFNIASSTPLPAIHYPKVAVYHKMPMNNIGSSFSVNGQAVSSNPTISSGTSANSPVFVSGFTRTYRPSIPSSSPINPTNIPHTYQTTFPTVHPSYSTVTSTVSSNYPTIASTSPTSTVGYTFIPNQGGSIHNGLGGTSGVVTSSDTTIGSNIGVRAGPGSPGVTYSTVATPTVQSSSVNYPHHVTATQPSFVTVQSPRVSLNQPTTGYFVAAGGQSFDGVSVAQGDSQQGEISKTINIAQPAIKTRRYEVRRPAIQKQFYDIEERIIVRPAGTVVLELDHPISQTPKGETIQDIGYHYNANGNNLNLEIGTPSENGIISQNNQQQHNVGNVQQVQGGNVGGYENVQNSGVLTTTQAPNIAFTTTTPENFVITTTPYPQDDDTVVVEARTRPNHNIGHFVVRNESTQSVPHDFRNVVSYQHQSQVGQPQSSVQCTEGCQRQGGVTYSQGPIQGGVTYSQGPIQGGVTYLKDSSMLSQQPQTRYYQQQGASDYPQHQSVHYYQPRPQIQQYSHLVQPNEQNFYHQNERTPSYQGQYNQQQSTTSYRQSPQYQQYRQQQQQYHPQQQAQYYQQETFNNYYPSGEQQFAQYYQLRPQMQQHSHLAQQQQQQNFQQQQGQKMPMYLVQYNHQQDTTSHKQSAPYQQEREEPAQVVEQTADEFQRQSVPFMISVGEPDFHYPPYVENIGSGNVKSMKSAKQVAYNNQDQQQQQQQQKQAQENTASTQEIDEDSVRSPQVSIQSESKGNSSASLTPQQSNENQGKYLNLILAQGGVSEVSGNAEQDQAQNGYLRSRVISATPAPKDAQPAREQVHTRRVVVSQPLETVQEVEVQEPITKFERLSIKQPAQYRAARISNVGAPIYSRPVLHPIAFNYQKVY